MGARFTREKVRRQPAQRGGRVRQGAGFEPRVWRAVEAEARRWNVTIPFVLSVMAADTLGIELDAAARYDARLRPALRRVR